jgi:anti-sigma factor RsiW
VSARAEISCRELVELVTDYLEGAMPAAQRTRFEEHLVTCGPCVHYLEQMRATQRAVGTLGAEEVDHHAREALLAAFRTWKQG